MQILKGIPASKGIAIGPGLIYRSDVLSTSRTYVSIPEEELKRFYAALEKAKVELVEIYQTAVKSVGQRSAEIFQAQCMMLEDRDLLDIVEQKILTESINAEAAFVDATEYFAKLLDSVTDEYIGARSADIRDVCRRVVRLLQNRSIPNAQFLQQPTIILAEDLVPSDTMQFNRSHILGFFTASGGTTSHTAILSKALGIPAVVGAGQIPPSLAEDINMILDGYSGQLFIDPDEEIIEEYRKLQDEKLANCQLDMLSARNQAVTIDNRHIEVVANIGNIDDALNAINSGAEGVGLLRTEFSYIEQKNLPTETELVQAYSAIFHTFDNLPVVVRTIDIGGDKAIPYLNLAVEMNPFLGNRGIRLCFTMQDIFKIQLRAILRAGVNTRLYIMFPMIAVSSEVRKARAILQDCMLELDRKNIPYNSQPQVGIMIEVPAAAMCADQLAKEVDFFSIGTNDLTQYTMAVDRTNTTLSYLVSPFQPAVLRLIKRIIDAGHEAGIWVGMCGEMAGEPLAIPVLLGMGLDEFSMTPSAIPGIKNIIRSINTKQARKLSDQVLECSTTKQVEELIKEFMVQITI